MEDIKVFTGNAVPELAAKAVKHLGLSLGKAEVSRFSDGEIKVEILENVRGQDVFIFQSTCHPCNDTLMELLIMADALKRASVNSITAVVPYYGYARQDRRVRSQRVPITARVVADMMDAVGIIRIITVDLHADQIQGYFSMPVDNIYSSRIVLDDMIEKNMSDLAVVSPDIGGVVRARAIAKRLPNSNLAIIDKRRPKANESVVMHIIGEVKDRTCVIVDDIVDTAGTLCKAAQALMDEGAKKVLAYCTHPVLSGEALNNIKNSCLEELIVTDTIPLSPEALKNPKIKVISMAPVIAETLRRVQGKESVSEMFE